MKRDTLLFLSGGAFGTFLLMFALGGLGASVHYLYIAGIGLVVAKMLPATKPRT